MRKILEKQTLLYPMPVLIIGTYDENGKADAMNAAWGGIKDTNQIYICLSPEHKTVKNLLKTKAITVSMGTSEQVVACDYVGIASGNREENKIEKTGWTVSKAHSVNAPIFEELPFALECEVESYDEESCMLVANIKNISCDEKILTDKNKIDVKKLRPITFDSSNNTYIELGDVVGQPFKDGLKLK